MLAAPMDADADLIRAQHLLGAGRWSEARPLLERLHAARPRDRTLFLALCDAEIASGAAAAALARLDTADADDHEALFLRARALHALDRVDDAVVAFRALRARLPHPSFSLEMHLSAAEARAGDAVAAAAALERAAAIDRAAPAAHDAAALLQLARAEAAQARHREVAALLERARQAGPRNHREWLQLGRLHADLFDWRRCAEALEEAARLEPGDPGVATLAAAAHVELGDVPAAERALSRAGADLSTDLPLSVAQRLLLPPIYADHDDLLAWRARFTRGVEALQAGLPAWRRDPAQVFRVNRSNFLLAYQGLDDRDLQRGYSSFIGTLVEAAAPELRERPAATFDGGRRLRVGFASSFFRECTIGHYFERWITGLDARRFERVAYSTGGMADDFTARLAASVDRFTLLRGGPLDAARRIRADALDVLVWPEIGMDSGGYLLATMRLAPVQLAAWGHPVTTGSDAIDGYLTVAGMEPADGATHYVERLVTLPGVGVDYPVPGTIAPMAREALGFPASAHLYACPQSLFKIHPDMDAIFASIAAADPDAVLLFFQGTAPAMTRRFGERLQRAFAGAGIAPRNQVKFLPRLDAPHFRGLLAACDVVLDTLHWSGGNTSFDAFAAGAPVVTLPGRFMRGRQSAAMLAAMGVGDLVASSVEGYVATAVRAARDGDFNGACRDAILRGREAIFDQHGTVAALGERLMALAARG